MPRNLCLQICPSLNSSFPRIIQGWTQLRLDDWLRHYQLPLIHSVKQVESCFNETVNKWLMIEIQSSPVDLKVCCTEFQEHRMKCSCWRIKILLDLMSQNFLTHPHPIPNANDLSTRGKQAFLSWWVKMSLSDFNDLIWVEINRKKTYFHP